MPLLDLEKLLRHPRKGDSLIPAPTALDVYCGDPADACALGYRTAAQLVVKHISHKPWERTFLFYPVVFLYRHYIELMLKKLILASDEPGVRSITQAAQLSESDCASLSGGKKAHSLQFLWDRLRPVALALGNTLDEDIEGINFYIQQLNAMDPDSVKFRYTTAIEQTKAKLRGSQKCGAEIDIETFAVALERLANYFDGLDHYLGAMNETYGEMP